ncbi:hypothetical protein F5B20DRAFT_477636 [Whalleya microplaca]|nr:hypothetical protein F5B20DRAFT_477636 [Whalleya microplaca]
MMIQPSSLELIRRPNITPAPGIKVAQSERDQMTWFRPFQKGEAICRDRKLHEAFDRISTTNFGQEKGWYSRRDGGLGRNQVLWVRQTWILLAGQNILTYGSFSKDVLEASNITIQDEISHADDGDRIIQIMDQDRRLFYIRSSKCKSFYVDIPLIRVILNPISTAKQFDEGSSSSVMTQVSKNIDDDMLSLDGSQSDEGTDNTGSQTSKKDAYGNNDCGFLLINSESATISTYLPVHNYVLLLGLSQT